MMADSQSVHPFPLDGSCHVADKDEETGTPSSTDCDERATYPAVLAGAQGGITFEHNGGGGGSSKADTNATLVWEGVAYRWLAPSRAAVIARLL